MLRLLLLEFPPSAASPSSSHASAAVVAASIVASGMGGAATKTYAVTSGVNVVITGGNRGIGKACVEQCFSKLDAASTIVLGARSVKAGEAAKAELEERLGTADRAKIVVRAVDVSDAASVDALGAYVASELGGKLDSLVLNGGINNMAASGMAARKVMDTNYVGNKALCLAMVPFLEKSASGRIVVLASKVAQLSSSMVNGMVSDEIKGRFLAADLTVARLDALVEDFLAADAAGESEARGFNPSAYAVSKCAVAHLVRVVARDHAGLRCASVFPGIVRTDMKPPAEWGMMPLYLIKCVVAVSPLEGADSPAWVALQQLPPDAPPAWNGGIVEGRAHVAF